MPSLPPTTKVQGQRRQVLATDRGLRRGLCQASRGERAVAHRSGRRRGSRRVGRRVVGALVLGTATVTVLLAVPPLRGVAYQISRMSLGWIAAARRSLVAPSWRMLGAVGYLGFDIAALGALFAATGHPMPADALVLGYLIGYLANMLPVPGGFGVLEAGLAGMLIAYGAPATQAAAAGEITSHRHTSSGGNTLMKPRAIDTKAANGRKRRHTGEENRRSPHPTRHGPPSERQRPGQFSVTDAQISYWQMMRRLRVCTGLLSAVLLASVAHAVIDGLTAGLALALALTTALLLASLKLWRIGSRRRPHDTAPPGFERRTRNIQQSPRT
jgi:hypothetical protein